MKNGIGFALLILVFSFANLNSVNLSTSESLLLSKISGNSLTENDLDSEYIKHCKRLEIKYEKTNKALIGLKFAPEYLSLLKNKNAYTLNKIDEKGKFSKLVINFKNDTQMKTIYLHDSKIIASDYYYKKQMICKESEYLRFYYTDSSRYNQLAVDFVNTEINRFLDIFKDHISKDRIALLKKQKIDYIICSSMNQMQEITGFQTNGIALLNDDTVVSIDPSHLHEITHLLINFIIKDNKLYTHPIFQEGLAVAFGGRSGRSPETIMNSAIYLLQNGFLTFVELLAVSDYQAHDPSLSYALSGLFNDYLLKIKSPSDYLSLYKKYSVNDSDFPNLRIDKKDLFIDTNWDAYLRYKQSSIIDSVYNKKLIKETTDYKIYQLDNSDNKWQIIIKKGVYCFQKDERLNNYRSRIFEELMPSAVYESQRYALKADNNEIILYSLDLDRMIYLISNGFSNIQLINELPNDFIEFKTDNKELIDIM